MFGFLRKSAVILSVALITAFAAGCSDDDDGKNGNGDDAPQDVLEVTGEIVDYDGDGGEIWERAGLHDVAEGSGGADGSLSFTLTMTSGIAEEELDPPATSSSDGFTGLVCMGEFLEDIEEARFLSVHNLNYTPEGGADSDAGTLELSTDTEGTLGSVMHPFPKPGHVYGVWLYTTESMTLQETCDQGEIDVDLQAGWNEVLIDTTEAFDEYTQWTGERPGDVDWRLVFRGD